MISVCVVNWRTAEETIGLAATLDAGAAGEPYELCVVDNDSRDGSLERLREALPAAAIVDAGANLGFGSGVNRAAREAIGEFLFVVNPDTKVRPGAIATLADFLRANPDVGLAAPMMVTHKDERQASARRFPSPVAAAFRGTPLGWLFPHNRYAAGYLMEDVEFTEPAPVDWVSGSAMLLRRQAFEALGGFDEDYFMYCEDVDLCKRLWDAGWRVYYHPGARVEHRVGASSDKAQAAMVKQHHRSMLIYYHKHMRAHTPVVLRGVYPLGVRLRCLFMLARRRIVWWRQHRVGGSDRV